MISTGEKWTRKSRREPGHNTIRIVGIDPNNLCIKYIRINGPLELIPRGRFLRNFSKIEDSPGLTLADLGHLKECDIFKNGWRTCSCKGEKT